MESGDGKSTQLAVAAAALQLLPENGSRLIRLQRLAALAATTDLAASRAITPTLIRRILKRPEFSEESILSQEDAFEDVLVERVSLFGAEYLASSGLSERSVWIATRILSSLSGPAGNALPIDFRQMAHRLGIGLLKLSDTILKGAGLTAGCEPGLGNREPILVPGRERLAELSERLIFRPERLADLFGESLVERLCFEHSDPDSLFADEPVSEKLIAAPLLRTERAVAVLNPLELMACFRIQVFAEAARRQVLPDLGRVLKEEIVRWTVRRLLDHGWKLRSVDEIDTELTAARFIVPDGNNGVCVLICADSLSSYRPDEPFGFWRAHSECGNLGNFLKAQVGTPAENDTFLVLVEAYGRGTVSGVEDEAPPRVLLLNGPDLNVLLAAEDHPLGLERFADALKALNGQARVFSFSLVDTFAIYQQNGDSFYFSDGPRPTFVSITAGAGTQLRIDAFHKASLRSFMYPRVGIKLDARPKYKSVHTPIYVSPYGHYMIANGSVKLWIVPVVTKESNRVDDSFLEAVAYWAWTVLSALEDRAGHILNNLILSVLYIPSSVPEGLTGQVVDIESDMARLEFKGHLTTAIAQPGNSVDRIIVRCLIEAISRSVSLELSEDEQIDLLNTVAPSGNKTMLTVVSASNVTMLPSRTRPRYLEESVMAVELDRLGEWLRNDLALEVGPVEDSSRVQLLNSIVDYYLSLLVSAVAELDPMGLLEALIGYDEALLFASEYDKESLGSQVACWDNLLDVEDIVKRNRRSVSSAVASRFLIEYVVAQPPNGQTRLSLQVYERLLALCSEIINRGMTSDAIKYGLTDMKFSILESGRLGVNAEEDSYYAALNDFVRSGSQRTLRYALGFEAQPSMDDEDWLPSSRTDAAFEGEFGFSLKDLARGLHALASIESTEDVSDAISRPVGDVEAILSSVLEWEDVKIQRFLVQLTLRPRARFVPRGRGPDVYPWRYNRELSYLRRPVLVRVGDSGTEELIWGRRHLLAAVSHWFNLIRGARLKAESIELKQAIAEQRNRITEAFNDQVADLLSQSDAMRVRRRVKKVGGVRVSDDRNRDLGDIDVLCLDGRTRTVWVVEAKDFEVARTPAEAENEVKKLLYGEKSTMALHARRTDWVRRNITLVVRSFGFAATGSWVARPIIVVSEDLVSARMATQGSSPVVPIGDAYSFIAGSNMAKRPSRNRRRRR